MAKLTFEGTQFTTHQDLKDMHDHIQKSKKQFEEIRRELLAKLDQKEEKIEVDHSFKFNLIFTLMIIQTLAIGFLFYHDFFSKFNF